MSFKIFGLAAVAAAALGCGQAVAADLLVDPPVAAEAPAASSGFWDGFYVGVFGGRASGSVTDVDKGIYYQVGDPDGFDVDGWMVGVKAGADMYLTGNLVAGIVGDVAWTDLSGEFAKGSYNGSYEANWVGSLRGRLGYDMGGIMPYVTAGAAFLDANAEIVGGGGPGADENLHVGWTAGAGVALAVSDSASVELEYRYSDYGEATYQDFRNGDIDTPFALTAHQITVGLNWSF